MKFSTWLDTFADEKGLDREHRFDVTTEGFWGSHSIPLGVVIDAAKSASAAEQAQIKDILVRIDFRNGDPMHFFAHLAKGLATAADPIEKGA